ncbi:MAG: DNA endonuclease [Cyanobacteriota bacterium]|nr:DNA endonuclease [Cyanobacteriota bacterium]
MDYNVSSKQEQRGILAGMLLGVAKREGCNFSIAHPPSQIGYLLFKKALLEKITRKPICLRERKTLNGDRVPYVEPKLIPLTRVLVKKLYPGGVRTITRNFLNVLTPQGIAIWFMDKGGKSFKKKAGRIHALEITLNTHLSKEANEVIVAYFAEVWGIHWGLSKSKGKYRLRLGTRAGKNVLAFLKPYIHSSMLDKIETSYNKTAAT